MVWLVAIALFVAWFVGKFILGKGGFVHIILLCAVAVAVASGRGADTPPRSSS